MTAAPLSWLHRELARARLTAPLGALMLALVVISQAPLFLCMPLTDDAVMYDIQARAALNGGVLYRDVLEPNLPGVVWLHMLARGAAGWSSLALRGFDLLMTAGVATLLAAWLRAAGRSWGATLWTSAVLAFCYFSLSEWCHTQRDTWLLVPLLAGLLARWRQLPRLRGADATGAPAPLAGVFGWALLEGCAWGLGVWLKPMIVLPALACWLASLGHAGSLRRAAVDALGLLVGGALVGALGVTWLVSTGAWPWFWDTLWRWNPAYFAAGRQHWTLGRLFGLSYRLFPWILLHAAALPLALWLAWRGGRADPGHGDNAAWDGPAAARRLLAVAYVAWLVQAFFLQHLFDYVHAPGLLLAVALAAGAPAAVCGRPAWRWGVLAFLLAAAAASPALRWSRLSAWPACFAEGSSPAVRERLAHFDYPDWIAMDAAARFLRDQRVGDGELACWHNNLAQLHAELGARPATRYVFLETYTVFFPDRLSEMQAALRASPLKYVATDLSLVLPPSEWPRVAPGAPLPPSFPRGLKNRFPWNLPIIRREGPIAIHEVPKGLSARQ